MPMPLQLSKADARRALVRHHFAQCTTEVEVFERLRSIQFDPIAPAGCNHDLVLQSRLPKYKIGDWTKTAYKDRLIYDGWDKMASLIPFEGWPVRRLCHKVHYAWFNERIWQDHSDAVEVILKELEDRGPLMPKQFAFQQRKDEWKVSWYGPSLTKQVLRALWHTGRVMTADRKNGQHLYDLSERVVPAHLFNHPEIDDREARAEIVLDRHRAMGILRPTAQAEIWSYQVLHGYRKEAIGDLLERGQIRPIEIEGMKAHATPQFLALLDEPPVKPKVVFVAPLDQFVWDRKMISHIFGFDYTWEIYVPEQKRKWGYYVLPVLFGDELVARAEFWARDGVLELRQWHVEKGSTKFYRALEPAIRAFMTYSKTQKAVSREHIGPHIRKLFESIGAT